MIHLSNFIICVQVLQEALGGSDWSGTQTGDATGSFIHGHRFTLQQQSTVISLVSTSHCPRHKFKSSEYYYDYCSLVCYVHVGRTRGLWRTAFNLNGLLINFGLHSFFSRKDEGDREIHRCQRFHLFIKTSFVFWVSSTCHVNSTHEFASLFIPY